MRSWRLPRGFTAVELLVALAGVAILAGIVAVTYARQRTAGMAAQVDLTFDLVVDAEHTLASDFGAYSTWSSDLGIAGSVVEVVASAAVTEPGQVSATVGAAGTLGLATMDADGRCYLLRVPALAAGGGTVSVPVTPDTVCAGADALPPGEAPVEQVAPVRP